MKSSSRFRQLRLMLAIALALFAPVAVIYINYAEDQKAFFTSRGFRQLGVVSRQISSRIDTLRTILSSIVTSVDSYAEKSDGQAPVDPAHRPDLLEKKALDVADHGAPPKLHLTARPTVTPAANLEIAPPTFVIRIDEHASPVRLEIKYDCRPLGSKYLYHLEGTASMDELAGQFVDTTAHVEGPEFDQLVIALRSSGAVMFQGEKPGLSFANLAEMAGLAASGDKQKPSESGSPNGYTALRDVTVAGEPYKLFIQPFGSLLNGKNELEQFLVCGLIRADRFNRSASAVPPTVLVIVLFLFLALTLSWPFIQLGFMGPGNRLRIYDVVFVAFSTVVGAGLLTLVVLDVFAYIRIQRWQDAQLRSLSDEISTNLKGELSDASDEIDALGRIQLVSREIEKLSKLDKDGRVSVLQHFDQASLFDKDGSDRDEALKRAHKQLRKQLRSFPYLDTVFWADQEGWQRIALTTDSYVLPLFRINDRDYFEKAKAGNSFGLLDSKSVASVEPVIARNSGKSLAAVAKKLCDYPWVAVLGTRLSSIMDTAIPDDIGFCIINEDGNALFHSDERRNLQENVFEECEESGELRSIVTAGLKCYLNTRYVGRSHRLYVSPISGLPWSLIVFRDKAILTGANFDLLTVSVSLLFLHCILLVVVLYALCPLHSKKRSRWIWPNLNCPKTYLSLVFVNLLLSIILYLVILTSDGWSLVLPALLIPILGLGTAYGIVAKEWWQYIPIWGAHSDEPLPLAAERVLTAKRLYAFGGATAVLLLVVMPAMAWFKLAHNRQVEFITRFQQVSFVKSLNRRSRLLNGRQARANAPAPPVPLRGNYYGEYFTRKPPDYSLPQPASPESLTGLESIIAWVYRHINQDVHFRGLQDHFSTTDSEAAGKVNLRFSVTEKDRSGDVVLESPVRLLGRPCHFLWIAGCLLLPCLILAGLYSVVRTISRRVFLIDLKGGFDREDEVGLRNEKGDLKPVIEIMSGFKDLNVNLLVLAGPPGRNLVPLEWSLPEGSRRAQSATNPVGDCNGSDGSAAATELPEGWEVVNGAQCSDEVWRSDYSYDRKIAQGLRAIVIDDFDYKMEDPARNKGKVDFLRELWPKGIRTIVISRVNPVYFAVELHKPDQAGTRAPNGSRNGSSDSFTSMAEYWDDVFNNSIKVHLEPLDGIDMCRGAEAPKRQTPAVARDGDSASSQSQPTVRQEGISINMRRASAEGVEPNSLRPSTNQQATVTTHVSAPGGARMKPAASFSDETSTGLRPAGEGRSDGWHRTETSSGETRPPKGPADPPTQWLSWVRGASGDERLLSASGKFTDIKYESLLDYRAIWKTLSRVERVTLFYICHDRFVSCKCGSVQDLLRRGLIRRDPALCPMSKHFRRFVISAIRPEEIYTGEAGSSPWNALRAPMMIALALALTCLFYTQRSILDSGLALAAALTVAIPAILRLVSILQRGKPSTIPEPGDQKE